MENTDLTGTDYEKPRPLKRGRQLLRKIASGVLSAISLLMSGCMAYRSGHWLGLSLFCVSVSALLALARFIETRTKLTQAKLGTKPASLTALLPELHRKVLNIVASMSLLPFMAMLIMLSYCLLTGRMIPISMPSPPFALFFAITVAMSVCWGFAQRYDPQASHEGLSRKFLQVLVVGLQWSVYGLIAVMTIHLFSRFYLQR